MAAGTVSRTAHFALHRMALVQSPAVKPDTGPGSQDPQALFGVGSLREQAWLGAMVPKRWARRSVTRHAIKRQIYAVGAEHELLLRQGAHVVRLRSGFDKRQFVSASSEALKRAVREELQLLFAEAGRRLARQAGAQPGATATATTTAQARP